MVMTVEQWLEQHPGHSIVVQEDATLDDILSQLNANPDVQDIYVSNAKGRVLGHISKLRIARLVLAEHGTSHSHRHLMERVAPGHAGELMSRHFPTAKVEEDLDTVINRQIEHRLHDMAVLDKKGRLVGTINLTTLLASFT